MKKNDMMKALYGMDDISMPKNIRSGLRRDSLKALTENIPLSNSRTPGFTP